MTAFTLDPSMTNIRQQKKDVGEVHDTSLVSPMESAQGVAFISAITQLPCPTLGECWKQVLSDPEAKSYANLRKNLNHLGDIIDARNQVRDTNVDFHPRYCALSISS